MTATSRPQELLFLVVSFEAHLIKETINRNNVEDYILAIMSSSNPTPTANATTATVADHNAHALLDQLKSMLKAFEEDCMPGNILSSSPGEHSFVYFGIHDSLTLKKQYDIPKLVHDEVSDGDQLDGDICQEEVDRAWEDFDSSWEHGLSLSSARSSPRPKRSGVRRGRRDSAEPSASETLTVMTKTHDGACRDGFIVIDNASDDGSSMNTASAA